MTKVYPFGKPNQTKNADDQDTPAQKVEENRTGREAGAPVGDSARVKPSDNTSSKKEAKADEASSAPKGVNKEVWAEAEHSASNMGGFSGVDDKGREALTRVQYDKMVATDKTDKEWAGVDGILGDVK